MLQKDYFTLFIGLSNGKIAGGNNFKVKNAR
jgi:hypothetical protein